MTIQTDFVQSDPPRTAWLKIANAIVDLLFPPHCVACQRLGIWLCPDCSNKIQAIRSPVCPQCGLPLTVRPPSDAHAATCGRCRQTPTALDGLRGYAFHSGPLREAIHQFKYKDLRGLAGPLGKLMAEGWEELAPPDFAPDAIVPVPLHPTRKRERGYNQATLLSRELGAIMGWPVVEGGLVRTKATAPQVELNAQERRDNVHNAFRCTDTRLSGKRVLLVDDVCTTGSTLESACTALRESGTVSVWAYTLARASFSPEATTPT